MAKKREKEAKAEVKGTETTTKGKKVMKAETSNVKVDHTNFRKMVNPILTKNKDLVLVENKHGAIQIKRDGQLLFSSRNDGVIITHPVFDGKVRLFKHPGDQWDHLTRAPHDKVTVKMLEARVADKKTMKDYFNQFYGKDITKSGLFQKRQIAAKRVGDLKAEATDKKAKVTKKAEAIQKTSAKKSAKVTIPAKKATKAIKKVAAEVA
jgi:hypothetical protein